MERATSDGRRHYLVMKPEDGDGGIYAEPVAGFAEDGYAMSLAQDGIRQVPDDEVIACVLASNARDAVYRYENGQQSPDGQMQPCIPERLWELL